MKFKVYAKYEDFAQRLNFYIFLINHDGSLEICTSIDEMRFAPYKKTTVTEPSFSLSGPATKPFLQAMANTLKEIGISADGEPVIANELKAVKYHLEDMRSLVFTTDNVD